MGFRFEPRVSRKVWADVAGIDLDWRGMIACTRVCRGKCFKRVKMGLGAGPPQLPLLCGLVYDHLQFPVGDWAVEPVPRESPGFVRYYVTSPLPPSCDDDSDGDDYDCDRDYYHDDDYYYSYYYSYYYYYSSCCCCCCYCYQHYHYHYNYHDHDRYHGHY